MEKRESKDKQIEEMSQIMHDGCAIVKETNQCRGEDCLDCAAVTCYEKGYRKASEVAEEIFAEIESVLLDKDSPLTVRCAINGQKYAELKKKYTEEGK